MLETLKTYNKLTADGLLARTSFLLEKDTLIKDVGIIENQDAVCYQVLDEISNKLQIKPDTSNNIKKIIDYIDEELEKSTMLDATKENEILIKLSNEAQLPTDLYNVKILPDIQELYNNNMHKETLLISETVKTPDIAYHFNALENENTQKDISMFVKYFEEEYLFDSFYLLVIGNRAGLDFLVHQVWHIYKDVANGFTDIMDLLNKFVDNFGIEVEFQGEVSKLFLSKVAKSEKDFHFKIDDKNITRTKKGQQAWTAFHFTKSLSGENKIFSLFFVIDILKYKRYLGNHKYKI
jgi:hypothetical protein